MGVTVRAAQAADRAVIKRLLGAFMDYLEAIEPGEAAADLDALVDQAFGPDPVCATLIAEREGEPIGYAGYHLGVWEIYRAIYVVSLFVLPEARGTGAGFALMDAAKAIARERGAKRIVWEVWKKNPPAIAFYEKIGGTVSEENLRMSLVVE